MGSLALREIMTHSEKNSMTSSNLKFLPLFSLSNPPKKVTFHIKGDKEVLQKKGKEWRLKDLAGSLGQAMCHALPFLHAFTGSDTTSAF